MALLPLSRNCPHLRHLSLTVDATHVQEDLPSRTPRVIQTALVSARFHHSPIESPSQVARFLSSVFPSLSNISTSSETYRKEWGEVKKLIPMFATIRADEKQFWVVE
jgi:hypothetical protein